MKERGKLSIAEILWFFIFIPFFYGIIIGPLLAAPLNNFFNNLVFTGRTVFIAGVKLSMDKTSAIFVAPFVEEVLKALGYGIFIFLNFSHIFKLGFGTRGEYKKYVEKHLLLICFLVTSGFGLMEGMVKRYEEIHRHGYLIYIALIFLSIWIHTVYTEYPLFLWKLSKKSMAAIPLFIPFAIFLHFLHNYLISIYWDNWRLTIVFAFAFTLPMLPYIVHKILQGRGRMRSKKINAGRA